MFKPNQ